MLRFQLLELITAWTTSEIVGSVYNSVGVLICGYICIQPYYYGW